MLKQLWGRATSMLADRQPTLNEDLEQFQAQLGMPILERRARHLLFLEQQGIDVAGKRILEIGGDHEGQIASAFRALGCEWVTSINIAPGVAEGESAENTERLLMDARAIELPIDSYDLVFGIAVLEHLKDIETVLEQVHSVLREPGFVYLTGGPLWNSARGHHLWLNAASGRRYRFSGDNPIDDWQHRLLIPQELEDRLIAKDISPSDAAEIVEKIYQSDSINRYSVRHLKTAMEASPFEIVRTRQGCNRPDKPTAARLAERHNLPPEEFETNTIAFLLRKT